VAAYIVSVAMLVIVSATGYWIAQRTEVRRWKWGGRASAVMGAVVIAALTVGMTSLRSYYRDRLDISRCPPPGPGAAVKVELGAVAEPDRCRYYVEATGEPVDTDDSLAGPVP